jgi:hypothetical protein
MRKFVVFVWGSLFCLVAIGCNSKPEGSVTKEMDAQSIESYQAETEGDNYKNYVEPK